MKTIRATFHVKENQLYRIKALAYYRGILIKDIIESCFERELRLVGSKKQLDLILKTYDQHLNRRTEIK